MFDNQSQIFDSWISKGGGAHSFGKGHREDIEKPPPTPYATNYFYSQLLTTIILNFIINFEPYYQPNGGKVDGKPLYYQPTINYL